MSATIVDLARGDFRTSRAADELNTRFQSLLGLPHRYGPARLALGRSLALTSAPTLELNTLGLGRQIKGEQLFGHGVELATWLTLLLEHAGATAVPRKDFQNLVGAHWHRGIYLLWDDWKSSGGEFDAFVARLVQQANRRRSKTTQAAS
ncbi:MAG: DndE family protein [Allosphingosinicella sp.]